MLLSIFSNTNIFCVLSQRCWYITCHKIDNPIQQLIYFTAKKNNSTNNKSSISLFSYTNQSGQRTWYSNTLPWFNQWLHQNRQFAKFNNTHMSRVQVSRVPCRALPPTTLQSKDDITAVSKVLSPMGAIGSPCLCRMSWIYRLLNKHNPIFSTKLKQITIKHLKRKNTASNIIRASSFIIC